MAKDLKAGDPVEWNTSGGKTSGRVVKKQISDTSIKGHEVKASAEKPQVIVESDKTGAQAAHKRDSLTKK